MIFTATKHPVTERGRPPDSFLTELVEWARAEQDAVFAPNDAPVEIFTLIRPKLGNDAGGWDDPLHRKAALCEAMRVHAGYESSWKWQEGVDKTNRTSMANIEGQETGIFQVSWDSTRLHLSLHEYARSIGILDKPAVFIAAMKSNHLLALSYYARLVRRSIKWAGPLLHGFIVQDLNRDAMNEFRQLLTA